MSAILTAAELAKALGGKADGKGYKALCPAHDDHDPSLSIDQSGDGRILVKCWAGCAQGVVLDALKRRGLWSSDRSRNSARPRSRDDVARERRAAGEIWRGTRTIFGTIVEPYLQRRGLAELPDCVDNVIRFHPECPFGPKTRLPCMVALFRNIQTNEPQAIHRTALTPDGHKIDRKYLGPKSGAAIKLADEVEQLLTIGEGVETTLSGMLLGFRPGWALGDALGVANFPVLPGIEQLTILVDYDKAGEEAARDCLFRWLDAGRKVRRVLPITPNTDMNDVLVSGSKA